MVEKKINARQLLLILICNIIGAGIFYVPHLVAKETSKNGISLSCWIFSAIIAVMFGQCYAELGSTYPYEGGDAWYLKLAYGDIVSYIYTFVSLFVILPCGCAVMLCTMCDMFPCSELRIKVLKASIAIAIGLINWAGSKYVFRIQYFLTMLKVMVVLFFVFFAALVFFDLIKKDADIEKNLTEKYLAKNEYVPPDFDKLGTFDYVKEAAKGVTLTLWAYDGWSSGNFIAHTIKSPHRSMPIAIASASIIVCILYVFVNISFFCVLPRVILIQKNLVGNFINILKINDTIKTILPYFINIIPSFGTLNGSYMVGMSIIEAYVLEFLSKNQKNPKTEKNKANITAQIESEINEDYKKSFNETENYEEHQEKHVEIVNSSHVSSDIDDTPKSEKSLLCNAPFLKFLGISLYSMIVIVFLQVNSKSIIEKLSFMIYLFYGLSLVALLVLRKKDKNRERLYKVPSILVYLCISFSVILFLNTLYYILKPMFPK